MTNKEKFEEAFGYDGSIVCNCFPIIHSELGSCGYPSCSESCASRHYPRCPKWWDDEFSIDYTMMKIVTENHIKLMEEECNKLKTAYESGQISFHTYWVETQNIISLINSVES